jgi:hypothetical protein
MTCFRVAAAFSLLKRHENLGGNKKCIQSFGPKTWWEEDLRVIWRECVDYTQLTQDKNRWRAVVNISW